MWEVNCSTHPEGRLHLGLEDVTLEMVRERHRRGRGVQRLLRQLLLLSLSKKQAVKVKGLKKVSRIRQQHAGSGPDLVHVDVQRGPRRRIAFRLQSLEQGLRDVQLISRAVRSSTL